ncbi:hypothetical protein [Flavisolibacter nicotianae]|uniref:hypothetical protein n=1 Tax=Flavisolibacter nicotianae TaxID=2364882 RepID=UPI000EAC31D7|nr:hypothetical protein [Flavisolibacter nicotianae]
MEQAIQEFASWVRQEKEQLYILCICQDDPQTFFINQIQPFYAKLCGQGRERVALKYRPLLNDRKQKKLTLRLQAINEGALDDLAKRLGVKK